jgi:predicted lipoprotein with Yx(FWY)xxD motif
VRTATWTAVLAAGVLALTGCGSAEDDASGGAAADAASAVADGTVLTTAGSDLGEIVVEAGGRTVYVFDKDTAGSGASACAGDCLAKWPPVEAGSADPAVDGVTADVGTITRDDGTMQVTLQGMPLYTYAGDSDAGDVTGQGVGGNWWVVAPDGAKVTGAPAPAPEAPPVPGY